MGMTRKPAPVKDQAVVTEINQIAGISYDQMRIEFLRLSPAYALMSKIAKKSLDVQRKLILQLYESNASALVRKRFLKTGKTSFTQDQCERILAGFDFVRETHKEYGDVSASYLGWARTNKNAAYLLNSYLNYPSTFLIAVEREHGEPISRFINDMKGYVESIDPDYIHEPRIVVSIPVNAKLKVVMQDVKKWMQEFALPNANQQYVSAKPLVGKRVHYDATMKKLLLLIHKSFHPDEPLWKLGLRARVSERYNKLAKEDLSGKHLSKDDKDILSATTSRALTHAQYIAENAARGLFPLHKKIITPAFDYAVLKARILKAWPDLEQ